MGLFSPPKKKRKKKVKRGFFSGMWFGEPKKKKKKKRAKRRSSSNQGKASWKQPVYIYRLKDGWSSFYVGRTVNPQQRLQQHISSAHTGSTPRDDYIYNMLQKGRTPSMDIITSTTNENKARELERKFVRKWGKTNTLLR